MYLDLIFVLNIISDALALYITARLSGFPVHTNHLITASLLGGMYSVLCYFSFPVPVNSFWMQIFVAALLVRLAFDKQKNFLRLFLIFYLLSCTIGGMMMALTQQIANDGIENALQQANWKVFLLAGFLCYFILTVVFRGNAKHVVADQLCRVDIAVGDQRIMLDALYDTGNTLCDPCSGSPVLTVWYAAVDMLFSKEEKFILNQLELQGSVWCAEKLGDISPGRFCLIPYRAVGVACAMLLSFRADEVCIDQEQYERLTVALSPTPVSDGEGYTALWGGERKGKAAYVTSNKNFGASTVAALGADPPR